MFTHVSLKHISFKYLLLCLIITWLFVGCSDDAGNSIEPDPINPADERLKTGFVVVSSQADNSVVASYFDSIPSGTIDLTQGTTFQRFSPLSISDGFLFMQRPNGQRGFAKMAVNGNQEFVEDGFISTTSEESFVMAVRDRNYGLFHDRNNPDVINIFDPSTMQVTGEIDMSGDSQAVPVRYQKFIFRGTDEVFMPIRGETGETFPSMPVYRADLNTNRLAGEITVPFSNDLLVTLNTFGQDRLDEQGNLYLFHTGNLSLPNVPGSILRITPGSTEFDTTYNFEAAQVFNPANLGPFVTTFYYHQNDIAYALINATLDQQIIDIITAAGGFGGLTQSQIDEITGRLFTSPTGAWAEVNVANQTVNIIPGMPSLSPFDGSQATFIDNIPYFAISSQNDNAVYKYDPADGQATLVFEGTGARIFGIYDLSIDQ